VVHPSLPPAHTTTYLAPQTHIFIYVKYIPGLLAFHAIMDIEWASTDYPHPLNPSNL
jgi:hypothetical protein